VAAVTRWGFDEVRRDPAGCCQSLVATGAVSYVSLNVVQNTRMLTTLEATFEPPPGLEDFPEETARITVLRDGTIVAVPLGDPNRDWEHRYPPMTAEEVRTHLSRWAQPQWLLLVGALCLEFPGDPPWLRWNWGNGLDTYIQMVQRHLLAEEIARKYGSWPAEDASHGFRSDGKPHPILTPNFLAA
jgi:hypothetical protein